MSFEQLLTLAVVQGLTEFLPVSSSGHLILVPILTGWPDQGLAIDVAVHVGTLLAVVVYFWRDVWSMIKGLAGLTIGRRSPGGLLAGKVLLATIPALLIGFLIDQFLGDALRDIRVVAASMIGFAGVLYAADRWGGMTRRLGDLGWGQALIIGLAQILAFIPGTSRSGITMVAARLMGFDRREAARFSFLMSIPAIAAAGLWEGLKLWREADAQILHDAALAAGLSAVAGFLAIAVLMRWLRRNGFLPFVIYRLVLGGGLIALILWG